MKAYLWVLWLLFSLLSASVSVAATPTPSALLKAKQEANAKGYIFETSHDDIVAKAKSEGKLRVLAGMEASTAKAAAAAFTKKYPFINLQIGEIEGTQQAERNILEIRSGARNWDVHRIANDRYADYLAHLLKADILGMAELGVLQIPPALIDPKRRNVLAFFSRFQVTAYNKNLLPPNQVPTLWEHLLRPEFKRRKFMLDTRAPDVAAKIE